MNPKFMGYLCLQTIPFMEYFTLLCEVNSAPFTIIVGVASGSPTYDNCWIRGKARDGERDQ
jgi:hypothetical protein